MRKCVRRGMGGGIRLATLALMTFRTACGLALAALLIGAGCGEIPEPESFAIGSSTTSTTAVAEPDDGAPQRGVVAQSESPATTEFVPSAPPDYLPEVLLSTNTAIFAVGPDGVGALGGAFSGLSSDRAVDDLGSGLIVQQAGSSIGGGGVGDVLWYNGEGGEPTVIDDTGARLLDVGYVGGSPTVVVLVGTDRIDRIRLVDNARTSMIELEDGEEVLDLSASGSLYAVVLANEQCGDLRFYSANGSEIDLNGPAEPDCIVPRRPAYGVVALSPDRGAVVYTKVRYRDDGIEVSTELIARELSTGTEYFQRRIGREGDQITALSFDGQRVAYLRRSDETGDDPSVSVVDLSADVETPIDLTGVPPVDSLSFARLPLAGSEPGADSEPGPGS